MLKTTTNRPLAIFENADKNVYMGKTKFDELGLVVSVRVKINVRVRLGVKDRGGLGLGLGGFRVRIRFPVVRFCLHSQI